MVYLMINSLIDNMYNFYIELYMPFETFQMFHSLLNFTESRGTSVGSNGSFDLLPECANICSISWPLDEAVLMKERAQTGGHVLQGHLFQHDDHSGVAALI